MVDVVVAAPGGVSTKTPTDQVMYVNASMPLPMDLVSDGWQIGSQVADMNGLPLDPMWGFQAMRGFNTCNPPASDPSNCDRPANLPACTRQPYTGESSTICDAGEATDIECDYTPQHENWAPVAYEGSLWWKDFSNSYFTNDYDYNFWLVTPGGRGATAANDYYTGPLPPAPLCQQAANDFGPFGSLASGVCQQFVSPQAPTGAPNSLHLEFDSREVDGFFGASPSASFWRRFQDGGDFNGRHAAGAHNGDAAAAMSGQYAIVTGLMGLDCCHSCLAELHPVFSIAMDEQNSPNPNDDVWAVMARTWGNEGACGSTLHFLADPAGGTVTTLIIRIPWWSGMTSVTASWDTTTTKATPGSVGQVMSYVNRGDGVYIILPMQDAQSLWNAALAGIQAKLAHGDLVGALAAEQAAMAALPLFIGELHLKWEGSAAVSPWVQRSVAQAFRDVEPNEDAARGRAIASRLPPAQVQAISRSPAPPPARLVPANVAVSTSFPLVRHRAPLVVREAGSPAHAACSSQIVSSAGLRARTPIPAPTR
jgi:hypothetical protein